MTSPAINLDQMVRRVGKKSYTYPGDGGTVEEDVLIDLVHEIRRRPASEPGSFVEGFRYPTDWTHVWDFVRNTGGDVHLNRTNIGGGDPIKYVWEKGAGYYTSGPSGGPLSTLTPLAAPSRLQSIAEIKALEKLQQGDFNLGIFIAEGKETVHTVAEAALAVACGVKQFRSAEGPGAWANVVRYQGGRAADWKKIPKKWLSLQYGWRPLMSDVQGSLKKLSALRNVRAPLIDSKGTANGTDARAFSVYGPLAEKKYQEYWRFKTTCRLWYRIGNPDLRPYAELGLLNPALIVWEKVPYSFVVDWFLPIGSWLNALGSTVGLEFFTGCYSVKSEVNEKLMETIHSGFPSSGSWQVSDDFRRTRSGGSFRRVVYSDTPRPGLYVKNPISLEHLANAMSLLVGAFR